MSQATTLHRSRSPAQEALAANVLTLRARRKFSQAVLAERAGISRPTVVRIELGEGDPKLEILSKIAAALGVGIPDLFLADSGDETADDDELARRAAQGREGNVDAWSLLHAVDEAAGHNPKRYSRAGRPRVAS